MVFQDGGGYVSTNGQYRVPVVFDNLIHRKEMPVTIGIFINPGVLPSKSTNVLARYNRTWEYDFKTEWGDGGHNGKHGGSIFPEAMRWLWRGYPEPIKAGESGADGMTYDTQGRLYVATTLGLQFCDQAGRVNGIISKPQNKWLSHAILGGENLDTLFVTCYDKVYRRKTKAKGVLSALDPVLPPTPRL